MPERRMLVRLCSAQPTPVHAAVFLPVHHIHLPRAVYGQVSAHSSLQPGGIHFRPPTGLHLAAVRLWHGLPLLVASDDDVFVHLSRHMHAV